MELGGSFRSFRAAMGSDDGGAGESMVQHSLVYGADDCERPSTVPLGRRNPQLRCFDARAMGTANPRAAKRVGDGYDQYSVNSQVSNPEMREPGAYTCYIEKSNGAWVEHSCRVSSMHDNYRGLSRIYLQGEVRGISRGECFCRNWASRSPNLETLSEH